MPPLSLPAIGRHLVSFAGLRPRRRRKPRLRFRPEFERVNRTAGVVPVEPELSGQSRGPIRLPERAYQLATAIGYRWAPSGEFRRRQLETRERNRKLHDEPGSPSLPPFLTYVEDTDVAPTRLEPSLLAPPDAGGALAAEGDDRDL